MSVRDAGRYPERGGGATGGWSGSETSRERAMREEVDGVRGRRSKEVFAFVRSCGVRGATDPEVQAWLGVGHGASSGALTRLHRDGHLVRLTERRDGNEVYVHPVAVLDRPVAPYRPNRGTTLRPGLEHAVVLLERQADHLREQRRLAGPARRDAALVLQAREDALRHAVGDLQALLTEAP